MLSTLAGFAFPPGAMMAQAAGPESQQEQPARAVASPGSLPTLPKTCLESDRANGNVTHLLNAIRDHPTADAWNALGVLYAQRNLLTCAIPAFETALGLQPDSAEARYMPKPLLTFPVVLARAQAGEANDTPYRNVYADETFGWGAVAGQLAVVDVEGGHSTMLQEHFVDSLAEAVMPYLREEERRIGARPLEAAML